MAFGRHQRLCGHPTLTIALTTRWLILRALPFRMHGGRKTERLLLLSCASIPASFPLAIRLATFAISSRRRIVALSSVSPLTTILLAFVVPMLLMLLVHYAGAGYQFLDLGDLLSVVLDLVVFEMGGGRGGRRLRNRITIFRVRIGVGA